MYELNYRVTLSNADEQERLKISSAMQLMQDCSEYWLKSEPTWLEYYEKHGMAQVLFFRQVDVVRRPKVGEALTTESSVFEVTPRFGYRNTVIYDADHKPCINSWSIGAFVNRFTGNLFPAPQEVCDSIKLEEKKPMNYLSRKILLPKVEPEVLGELPVWKDYIDYNHHVNAAQYIRLSEHCLPDDFEINGLRVEYKHPARPGDVLTPYRYQADGKCIVVLKVGDEVCTIVEFY